MRKKGQAAMEFLMTYGWAIIVVLAAIAALAYFGVLSPANLLPERTVFSAPLQSTANAVVTVGNVTVALSNLEGARINVTGITATDDCTITGGPWLAIGAGDFEALPQDVSNGEQFRIRFTCDGLTAGDRFSSNIAISYTNLQNHLDRTHTGEIQGRVN